MYNMYTFYFNDVLLKQNENYLLFKLSKTCKIMDILLHYLRDPDPDPVAM